MSQISRLRKSRSAHRNLLNGLVVKAKEIAQVEDGVLNEKRRQDISDYLVAIESKRTVITELDGKILDLVDEEDIEEEVENATKFDLKTISGVSAVKKLIEIKVVPKEEETVRDVVNNPTPVRTARSGVRLPKVEPKKFLGDPTKWQQFIDTFNVAIDSNPDLSTMDKFTYLQGYVKGSAEKCIEGLPMTEANYPEALKLLKERFANPQRIATAHMSKLMKIDRVTVSRNVSELRNLYDHVESHMRALTSAGTPPEHYGPLIIPIISERLPEDIQLEISRKLGTDAWDIKEYMKIWKEEITARESVNFKPSHTDREKERQISTESLVANVRSAQCVFCPEGHYPDKCHVVTDVAQRKSIIMKKRLCFRCMSSGHPFHRCKSTKTCYKCKSPRHHTAICGAEDEKKQEKKKKDEKDEEVDTLTTLINARTSVLLQTAQGVVTDRSEKNRCCVNILLDSGSQRTYITEKLVNKLKLIPVGSKRMTVKGFGDSDGKSGVYPEYRFCVKNMKRDVTMFMSGYSVPYICSSSSGEDVKKFEMMFPGLENSDFSDVCRGEGEIHVLVGADYYWSVVEGNVKRSSNGLTAIETKLGWVLSGPVNKESSGSDSSVFFTTAMNCSMEAEVVEDALGHSVEKMWDLETLGICEKERNEKSMYDTFVEKIEILEDGRYEVPLPAFEERPFIEDHYSLCEKRLLNYKKNKLDKDEDFRSKYDEIFRNQLRAGILEEANSEPNVGEVTYLPHRAVLRDDKLTTKLRVVFDCSAKSKNGRSLNDCLWKGENLVQQLFEVLLRVRVGEILLTADAEQAYLNISVEPSYRDYLRTLWFDDVTKTNPEIIKLRFARVLFGATPSQFILNTVLITHLEKYRKIDPEFVEKLLRCLYIDDLNYSANSKLEGEELYKKAKLRFLEAKFNLRKWRTNNEELRKFIHEKEIASGDVLGKLGDKVLGIQWDEIKDEMLMDMHLIVEKALSSTPTKRHVLAVICSIYDPLGFLQPIIVSLKIIFQEVWGEKISWDGIIGDNLKTRFHDVIESIKRMGILRIPRCYCHNDVSDPIVDVTLHGFSDGSNSAYACCVYLKFVKRSGVTKVSFVASKSRVVPLKKKFTTPLVETMGNLLLSRLMINVMGAIKDDLVVNNVFCWSDSTVSLAWIKSEDKVFKPFVQNRVTSIRENVRGKDWYYCRTDVNPADIATRVGGDPNSDLWRYGPDFLYQPSMTNQKSVLIDDVYEHPDFVKEIKSRGTKVNAVVSEVNSCLIGAIVDVNRYSDYMKLLRVTGFVLRFIENLKRSINKRYGMLKYQVVNNEQLVLSRHSTLHETNDSRRLWLLDNQAAIKKDRNFYNLVRNLNLVEDDVGLLRSFSRLKNAKIPFDSKAPIFLNRDHRLTELIVWYCHVKVMHQGPKDTLTELRSKFWVTRGLSYVNKLLHPCKTCKVLNARPYEYPNFSDMPKERFTDQHPFVSTGVDFMGPIMCLPVYGDDSKMYKAWIALFTCTATRAVILEVVHNGKADTFIDCFRRFIARRGCPQTMMSDNGGAFIADETQQFAAKLGIKWKLNLDEAPWTGGIWERLVASVKRCIKKVVGTKRITYVELLTLVNEIELILNNRPIGVCYNEDHEDVLTPSHLLFGRRLDTDVNINDVPSFAGVEGNSRLLKRKKTLEMMINHFWQRWRKEYLTSLRERQKIGKQKKCRNIRVGDVVLIFDDKQPRHLWKLGKVENLVGSSDGAIRGAEVKLTGGDYMQDFTVLYFYHRFCMI